MCFQSLKKKRLFEGISEKNIQKDPTPDFGLLVKLSDGKCNNSPLMNSFLDDTQHFLYYHGVADKIRWVPKFIDAISGEI